MSSSNRTALKAGSWYVISNILNKGIIALSTPFITRLLTPEEFGVAGTYNSLLSILTILGTLNISSSVAVARFDYDTDDEYDQYISSVLFLSTAFNSLLFLIFHLFRDTIANFTGIPPILIYFMYFNIIFTNAFNVLQIKHRSKMKYKAFVFLSIIIAVVSPIFSIVLIGFQDSHKYLGRIFGIHLPTMIIGFAIIVYVLAKTRPVFKIGHWKYSLNISLPLIPHNLSNNILSESDRLIINYFRGPAEVGLYTLAYSYSNILSTIWNSFNQAWSPWFMEKLKEEKFDDIIRAVKPYTIVFSILFLGMIAVGPEALRIFGPAEYQDGVWVIAPVLLGLYFQFAYSLYVNAEIYYKKTKYVSMGTLVAGIIDLGLNIVFIPIYGFIGAAYTTLVGYLILFIIHYVLSNRIVKRDFVGNGFIITWSILMVVFTAIFTVLTNYMLLRYILFLVLFIVLMLRYRIPIITQVSKILKDRKSKS